jgi:class 3 adenylate cyclase
MRDSLTGNDRIKQLTQLEMNFNFEREQLADSLEFAKEAAIQNERIQRQRIGLVSIGSMVVLVLGLAFSIYHGKRRSDHLLLNILPAKIAEELKATGTAKAKRLENVTVLFTDFKGFTAISEKLTPEELVAEIHECFIGFDRIIDRYGIEKIKTIGDAYMAAGGVPEPKETHAVDVVAAALDIQSFMQQRAEMKRQQGLPFFEVRIGVHTGPVVAGIVGIRKFQYDIWGDTVNTASRLESSGESGKVNVSHTTYELIKQRYHCTHRGKIAAKGKGQIDMYFVDAG